MIFRVRIVQRLRLCSLEGASPPSNSPHTHLVCFFSAAATSLDACIVENVILECISVSFLDKVCELHIFYLFSSFLFLLFFVSLFLPICTYLNLTRIEVSKLTLIHNFEQKIPHLTSLCPIAFHLFSKSFLSTNLKMYYCEMKDYCISFLRL